MSAVDDPDALVEPAFWHCPEYAVTIGPEVADLVKLFGRTPNPEQRLLLDGSFGMDRRGRLTAFEEFVTADVHGRDAVVEWQIDHRSNSPYPLRHNGTNVHVTSSTDAEASFRSYLFVTHMVEGAVANLSSGLCLGKARVEDGTLKLAQLRVILDFTSSETFSAAPRQQPA